MSELHLPWLELLILLPLLGAAVVSRIRRPDLARRWSLVITGLALAISLGAWIDFATLSTFEAHDHWDLFRGLFHRDLFVIDELNAPLLPLSAVLYFVTILATLRTKVQRFSFTLTLVSESILLATLTSHHPWMVVSLLVAGTIPPMIELVRRRKPTRVFYSHMILFILLLVTGQLLVEFAPDPTHPPVLPVALITAAVLLRSGAVPTHCWMTDLFEHASFGTALLFVLPMPGAYAVMRLIVPIGPTEVLHSISNLSLVTAVYAACMSLVQRDSRRFFCYLFLSHSSMILVGLEALNPIGLAGALCVWLSVGISLGGFGLTLRSIESRTGRLSLQCYHGLFENIPMLAAFFIVTGLGSIGFPGTIGFIGTELLVEGAIQLSPRTGVVLVLTAAINSLAVVHAYFRIFTGTRHDTSISLRARTPEKVAVLMLTFLIIGGGLFPQPGVASRYHAAIELSEQRAIRFPATTRDPHQPPTGSGSH